MNLNRVTLAGFLTRDIELSYTPRGTAVAKCCVAVNRKWKDESGEAKEEVTFIDFTALGRTAEAMGQYLRKGRPLYIEGRLKLDQWEDKQTQQKRQKLSVVVESFQFLNDGKDRAEAPAAPRAKAPVAAEAGHPAYEE